MSVESKMILQKYIKLIWLFPKIWYPQIIHFNRVFHYKPFILGYPDFWKHPYHSIDIHGIYFECPATKGQRILHFVDITCAILGCDGSRTLRSFFSSSASGDPVALGWRLAKEIELHVFLSQNEHLYPFCRTNTFNHWFTNKNIRAPCCGPNPRILFEIL